jgi:hypothetical protein
VVEGASTHPAAAGARVDEFLTQEPPADEAEPRPQHRAAGASASRTRPAMAVIAWAASLAGAVAT